VVTPISLAVNGRTVQALVEPRMHLGDFLREQVFHHDGGILDERLFHQTAFLIELLQFAVDDLWPRGGRLAHLFGLPLINRPLLIDDVLGNVFALHVRRLGGGDLQRKVVHECFEFLIARDEVGFTVDLDQYADFAAHVDVGVDQALIGFAARFLLRGGEALLPQVVDRLVDVVARFLQRLLAIQDAGTSFLSQFLD